MVAGLLSAFRSCLGIGHRLAFGLRFFIRSISWKPAKPRTLPSRPNCLVSGYFNEALGIGRAGQLVATAIEQAGLSVIREDLRPFDRGLLTRSPDPFIAGKSAQVWLIEANPPEAKIALFSHDYHVWKDLYRIGFWHWESSVAPADWAHLAPWFHEIWVSSTFTAEALGATFRKTGLTDQIAKLRIMPLPVVSPVLLQPVLAEQAEAEAIKALIAFDPRSAFDRKNPMAVIQAWVLAFPEPVQARLTIKALDHADSHPAFLDLQMAAKGRPDILFMAKTLSQSQTEALIGEHDILISLHRGEGFGLTLAEGMSMGLSVIATGWSGNMQFMTPDNSIPVPYRLIPASRRYNGPEAQWADPDIAAAAHALKALVTNAPLREKLGRQAICDIDAMNAVWSTEALFCHKPSL